MKPEHNGPTLDAEAEAPPPSARDAINAEIPLRAAAAPMPRGARVAEKARHSRADRTDAQWRVWLDKLRDAVAVLYRREEVVEIGNRPSVGDAIASGPEWVRTEVSRILAENYARFPDDAEPDAEELPEIVGQDRMGAG